jgi:hypothetical protein
VLKRDIEGKTRCSTNHGCHSATLARLASHATEMEMAGLL